MVLEIPEGIKHPALVFFKGIFHIVESRVASRKFRRVRKRGAPLAVKVRTSRGVLNLRVYRYHHCDAASINSRYPTPAAQWRPGRESYAPVMLSPYAAALDALATGSSIKVRRVFDGWKNDDRATTSAPTA